MEREDLYELLDLETGSDFQYFENVAELFETDEEIDVDLISELLEDIEMDTLAKLLKEYFEQAESGIPDSEIEFYTLFEQISRSLIGMAESCSNEEDELELHDRILQLAEKIDDFRNWYTLSDRVECVEVGSDEAELLPVRDALAMSREERLGGKSYRMDFQDALDYELDEYVMSFADIGGTDDRNMQIETPGDMDDTMSEDY